jgi:hypothetical protein
MIDGRLSVDVDKRFSLIVRTVAPELTGRS